MTSTQVVQTLRHNGHKITQVRKGLIEIIFGGTTKPVTVSELIYLLKQNKIRVNKTTVYRQLQFLLTQKLIQVVDFADGIKRYEIAGGKHHHHLVCDSCGFIEDIPLDENLLISKATQNTQFRIERHSLEFFGKCVKCQEN